MSVQDRALLRFQERIERVPFSECWYWIGYAHHGYGYIGSTPAHRRAYEIGHGEIPAGLHIDHLCGQRLCVNPSHLEAVTQAENNRRSMQRMRDAGMKRKVRADKLPTHCANGHEFTLANTLRVSGRCGRVCRTCKSIFNIESKRRVRTR